MKSFALVLLSLVALHFSAYSQSLQINGTLTDSITAEPLQGASISIPLARQGTFTDEKGDFSLNIPSYKNETIDIIFSFSGYQRIQKTFKVQGESLTISLRLTPVSFTTDDVVITASKGLEQRQSDVTNSIAVIKQDAINLQAVPDIERVITQIPGVDNLDGQVNIRGSSGYAFGTGSRVMVMLNGLPMLSAEGGSAQLGLLPVDNISRIEVLKGASSVLYGSGAMGGVINVITQEPSEKPRTSIRLRGGFFDQPANPLLDWDGDASAYQYSAHIFHSRKIGDFNLSLHTDLIKDSGYRQGTDKEQFRGYFMGSYTPKAVPGLEIGLNFSALVDSGGAMLYWASYLPDTINPGTADEEVRRGALTPTSDPAGYRLDFDRKFAFDPMIKYLSPNGNLFWYRGRHLNNINENNTGQSNNNLLSFHDFLFQTTLADKINWVSGASYQFSRAEADSLFSGRKTGNSLGVYTQFDAKFGKLNTSLGFRLETVQIDSLERETEPIFRAGLNYELAEGTNIRASFGQAFRVPTVAERFTTTTGGGVLIAPNPDIDSETGYTWEVGLRQGFKSGTGKKRWLGYIDAAYFFMRFEDMVEFGVDGIGPDLSVFFSSVNLANARIPGVEITTQNSFQLNKWRFLLSGGVTWIEPEDLDAVPAERQLILSDVEENPIRLLDILDPDLIDQPSFLKYRNKWTTRFSATASYDRWSLSTNFRNRSFQENIDQYLFVVIPGLQDFREKHPNGDTVWDFILSYKISKEQTLSLNVDNAFNEEYLVIPGFLAEQRKFSLQYAVRF
ncbi:MAG: TonB-dependent receptor [Bacteroidota bacterium]